MFVLTALTEGAEFDAIVKYGTPVSSMEKVPNSARVVRRFGPDVTDARLLPKTVEYALVEKKRAEWLQSKVIRPFETDSYLYRFWFLDKSFFSAAPLQYRDDISATHAVYMDAVWAANNFTDRYWPFHTFWYVDIGWQPPWLAQVAQPYVHDVGLADTANLGEVLQPETFYQALSSKIDGSCCR